jgi:predicted metal-dependent peptidase
VKTNQLQSQSSVIEPYQTLSNAIVVLLRSEPFYAHIIQQMSRSFDERFPACAGVWIRDTIPHLIINPLMFAELSVGERVAILKHEIYHVLLLHQFRQKNRDKEIFNCAADIAANQYISNLPSWVLTYQKFKLPPKLTAEQYYELIIKNAKIIRIGFRANGKKWDDHSKWPEGDKDVVVGQQVVKSLVQEAMEKSRGHSPYEMHELLGEILQYGTLPWFMILRMFVASAQKVNFGYTWKKENRRFEDTPGRRKKHRLNLLVGVDTSGSISNEELKEFFGEIHRIHQNPLNEITVAECDAAIHAVYKYRGKPPEKITGRGGTAFQPVLDYAFERMKPRPDAVIYLTDGYGEDNLQIRGSIPLLWVLTWGGKTPRTGKVVELPPRK